MRPAFIFPRVDLNLKGRGPQSYRPPPSPRNPNKAPCSLYGVLQPAPTPPLNGHKSGGGVVSGDITGHLARFPHAFRGLNARYALGESTAVADGSCWRAEAKGGADAGDGHSAALSAHRARQSREYESICSSACVQCLGLTGACAACSQHYPAAAGELSGLDHSHEATPQRVTRASCAQLLHSVVHCAWRRLPLICLKLLVSVCVRDGLAASVCVCRTSTASVELLPRGWRAVAFPRWLHDKCCSTWLIVPCCINSY